MNQHEPRGPYGWKAWRIERLLKMLELKALGLTDKQVADNMPISKSTVSRELNSSQAIEIGRMLRRRAEGMVMPLVMKQLQQIEGDKSLTPGQKLIYRGKLIGTLATLVPKQIESKSEVTLDTKEFTILLSDVGAESWEKVKKDAEDEPRDSESPPE